MFLNFFFATITIAAAQNALPNDFLRCQQRDSKINDCLKKAVPDALRRMKDGIPSLSVPPLEPLLVSGMNIESGAGPVVITQIYKAIKMHGLTDSILTYYKADLKHYRLRTDSITPKLEFIADYVMKGRILVLPIQGKGVANITMVNLVVKHDLIGEPVVRDGETYMHIKDYKVKFVPGKVYLHFTNLFNGDKRLGDQMNIFLNENSDLVFNELKAAYEESLSSVFKTVTNLIFDKVPMKHIFTED
ncbi:protein takeout [Pararge aegeria]|uniref:Jg11144 protein n=2 Tax=Pararge aegeria TaxID=116150 RepID=A0A8S4RIR6_9NEOP|nr:protein takeout [Pararge aegeria]CAH2237171.1 jg11144 [Pararge aegeria aegeria]